VLTPRSLRARCAPLILAALVSPASALADEVLTFSGEVPDDGSDFFSIPFEVGAGFVEIEVAHDDGSTANILDWGVFDPNGFRGYGGGNDENAVIGELAASRSYKPGPIVAGTWEVLVGKAKIVSAPATYDVTVTLRETATLAPDAERGPYAEVALSTTARFYAGDFHVHSRESGDADATFDEIADLARTRGLDFVVITDHNTDSHVDFLSAAQARHDDVLFVPGCEFTTYDGHVGATGATAYVDHRLGVDGRTMDDALRDYANAGDVLTVNHPMLDLGDLCIGCAWGHDDEVLAHVTTVEIMTGANTLFLEQSLAFWDSKFDRGFQLVPVGGSDDHRAGRDTGFAAAEIGTPTTMVYASGLSSSAIQEGVRRGLTVVRLGGTEGPMVELAMDPPRESSTWVYEDSGVAEFPVRVTGGAGHELVLVRDGFPIEGERTPVASDDETFEIALDVEDGQRLRAELWDDARPVVVTSHLVFQLERGVLPPDDCNCGSTSGDASPTGIAALALVFLVVRRRGARR